MKKNLTDISLLKEAVIREYPDMAKRIRKEYNWCSDPFEGFVHDTERYLRAIARRGMICIITSVSGSGMSRRIKFIESVVTVRHGDTFLKRWVKANEAMGHQNFTTFFIALGYGAPNSDSAFKISGTGMDMVFHTNYTICHRMHRLGVISKQECDVLCQMTPNIY